MSSWRLPPLQCETRPDEQRDREPPRGARWLFLQSRDAALGIRLAQAILLLGDGDVEHQSHIDSIAPWHSPRLGRPISPGPVSLDSRLAVR
jgi:hypothetical protein